MPIPQHSESGADCSASVLVSGTCVLSPEDADACLLSVMRNERNRAMLASLEDNLLSFLADNSMSRLPFPPKSLFFCKVCQAVAQLYKLDCEFDTSLELPQGLRKLVLSKTPSSCAPVSRVSESLPLSSQQRRSSVADQKSSALSPIAPALAVKNSMTSSLRLEAEKSGGFQALNEPLTNMGGREALRQTCSLKDAADSAEGSETGLSGRDKFQNPRGSKPATVLRRRQDISRSVSSSEKADDMVAQSSASLCAGMKSVTEEEYEMARARIFRDGGGEKNSADKHGRRTQSGREPKSISERFAKGPSEASNGFLRNRWSQTCPPVAPRKNVEDCERQSVFADENPNGLSDRLSNFVVTSNDAGFSSSSYQASSQSYFSGDSVDSHDPDFDRYRCLARHHSTQNHVVPMFPVRSLPDLSVAQRSCVLNEQNQQPYVGHNTYCDESNPTPNYFSDFNPSHHTLAQQPRYAPDVAPFVSSAHLELSSNMNSSGVAPAHDVRHVESLVDSREMKANGVYTAASFSSLQPLSIWEPSRGHQTQQWPSRMSVSGHSSGNFGAELENRSVARGTSKAESAQPGYGLDSLIDFPVLSRDNAVSRS